MRYLSFLLFLFCLSTATSASAINRKVILLETMPVPVVQNQSQEIVQAFAEKGYLGNKTFELEILKAQGSKERAVELLKNSLAEKRPDLVITVATLATQTAIEVLAGTDIPILFCVVSDPVGSGIIKELGVASGKNISGVLFTQQRDTMMEMVLRLLPHTQKDVGVKVGIVCTDYPSAIGDVRNIESIAALSGEIEFIVHQIPYTGVPEGLNEMRKNFLLALETLRGKVDYLWEVAGPLGELDSFTKTQIDSGIPVILGHRPKSVELGALLAVVADVHATGQQMVEMTEQFFSGVDVGTLPITVPTKFGLYLNMKTATKLGLKVPSHLLMIAGKNVVR